MSATRASLCLMTAWGMFAAAASAQTLLGSGEVAVVTDEGFFIMNSGYGVSATRVAPASAFGELTDPAVEWRRGTDDFVVVSDDHVHVVTVTSLVTVDSATVTDVTPTFPSPSAVELSDIDVDPGTGDFWIVDRLGDRAFRLAEPLTQGAAPAQTLAIDPDVDAVCVDSRRYPFSIVTADPSAVERVKLNGSSEDLLYLANAQGLDIDPTTLTKPIACKPAGDVILRVLANPSGGADLNFSASCAPVALGPLDVEWNPILGRLFVFARDGVNLCQFPGADPQENFNHVVSLPLAVSPNGPEPRLVTRADGSDIEGDVGDLAIANAEFAFSEPYGPACELLSGAVLRLDEVAEGGPPAVGNDDYTMIIKNAPPSVSAFLLYGFAPTSAPLQGCTLLVDDFELEPIGTTDTNGELLIPLPIPNDPGLAGFNLYWQGRVLDTNGQGRLSNGLITHFGF